MTKINRDTCISNLLDYWKALAHADGDWRVSGTTLSVTTGIDDPLYNPIFSFEAENNFKIKAGRSLWHFPNLERPIPAGLLSWGPIPIMASCLSQLPDIPDSNEFKIMILENCDDLLPYFEPAQISFELDEKRSAQYRKTLEANAAKLIHFVIVDEDTPVGFASLFTGSGYAGAYNLAVLPEYRRRGMASMLHIARMRKARELGFEYITLQATPMAIALDTRLGFETVEELNILYRDKT